MTVSTAGRKGKLSKTVTVETNDPKNPKTKLTVSGNILVELDFDQPYLRFAGLKVGTEKKQTVKILAKEPEKLELGEVTTDVEGVTAEVVKSTGENGKPSYSLLVTFVPKKAGRFTGAIMVKTNHPKASELKLRMGGEVDGDITMKPPRLTIWAESGGRMEHSVVVTSEKKPFKIMDIEGKDPRLTIRKTETKKGYEYKLIVEPTKEGTKSEKVFSVNYILRTDSKEQPTLELPVYYRTRAPRGVKSKTHNLKGALKDLKLPQRGKKGAQKEKGNHK